MTSFMIKAHLDRKASSGWGQDENCTFCRIIKSQIPAWKIWENEDAIAILDVLPIRPGHTLIIPKAHFARVSELPPHLASTLGQAVSRIAMALRQALEITGLNVVCNEEYAQAVPHVHYHVIPAPDLRSSPPPVTSSSNPKSLKEMHLLEYQNRGQLEDSFAAELVNKIRPKL